MQGKDLIIGILKPTGYLKMETGEVLLTTIDMKTAQSPASAPLKISEEKVDKMALVRGDLSGDVLYSASIVEIISPFTEALFRTLNKKGVISLEELEPHLFRPESVEKARQAVSRICALVIGHKKESPGANNNKANISEFGFNEDLSLRIEKRSQNTAIKRVYRRTYESLPGDINGLNPDFVISLHCNAFNQKTSGSEVLYYYKSKKGQKIAEVLQKHLVACLKLSDRGIKAKDSEERGGYLLKYTNAPCVIAEPFFIDNDKDLEIALGVRDGLAEAYANAIDEISNTLFI